MRFAGQLGRREAMSEHGVGGDAHLEGGRRWPVAGLVPALAR